MKKKAKAVPKIQETTYEVRTSTKTITLVGEQIIWLLKRAGKFDNVPDNASVTLRVPGGADWSNETLDIDKHTPVEIRWEERYESGG